MAGVVFCHELIPLLKMCTNVLKVLNCMRMC